MTSAQLAILLQKLFCQGLAKCRNSVFERPSQFANRKYINFAPALPKAKGIYGVFRLTLQVLQVDSPQKQMPAPSPLPWHACAGD